MKFNTVARGTKSEGSSQMKNGAFIYFNNGLKMLYPFCPILDLEHKRKLFLSTQKDSNNTLVLDF